jgi:hypothetical protein
MPLGVLSVLLYITNYCMFHDFRGYVEATKTGWGDGRAASTCDIAIVVGFSDNATAASGSQPRSKRR